MKKDDHIIVGVHLRDRMTRAADLQKLMSEYGCNIKTRLGLHEVSDDFNSPNGLILLELAGDETRSYEFIDKLKAFDGVDAQTMVFDHD